MSSTAWVLIAAAAGLAWVVYEAEKKRRVDAGIAKGTAALQSGIEAAGKWLGFGDDSGQAAGQKAS